MKKRLLLIAMMLGSLSALSQTFYAYRFDNEYSVILKFPNNDGSKMLSSMPKVSFLLFSGDTLKLQGFSESERVRNFSYMGSHMVFSSTTKDVFVSFPITREQIEMLQKGVSRYAINTIPEIKIEKFKKDKIGNKLYKEFMSLEDELK